MKSSTKKLVLIAMLSALAYLLVALIRIPIMPVLPFLKYEPKDVVITVGGFILGPWAAFLSSLLVSFLEMVTVSDTGPIGMVMNLLSTCCFACTAAFIYKKKHTLGGAVLGLTAGSILMISAMLLWNWLITPLYMGVDRSYIQGLLIPAFLPFNALKAGLNTALTIALYKPLVTALRKTRLLEPADASGGRARWGIYLLSGLLLSTCILLLLVFGNII